MRHFLPAIAGAAALFAAPARAADDNFEVWINPSLAIDIDDDTGVEIETAQRFRDRDAAADTYFARLWLNQSLSDRVTIAGAVEYRVNAGGNDETRLLQQASLRRGLLRGRLRLEQRFVEGADRTGWRLRPRVGVAVPLDSDSRWTFGADAEAFFTLQSTGIGGQDGLTGLRTQVGVNYDITDRMSLGLTYLRQQDIRRGRADSVGHAPVIGIEFAL